MYFLLLAITEALNYLKMYDNKYISMKWVYIKFNNYSQFIVCRLLSTIQLLYSQLLIYYKCRCWFILNNNTSM